MIKFCNLKQAVIFLPFVSYFMQQQDRQIEIGRHVSISPHLYSALEASEALGCNAMQIFTSNPRGWKPQRLDAKEAGAFVEKKRSSKIKKVVAHMPYLPNLASPKENIYNMSKEALEGEVRICETLGIDYLVMHLGSHLGSGGNEGRRRVADAVSGIMHLVDNACILMENEAGQKNSVGSNLEELHEIRDMVHDRDKLGFCIDTCHAFAAGYDIRKKEVVDDIMRIGGSSIKVFHLNDAKAGIGSHLDRHENIGFGEIGKSGFNALLGNARARERVFILETPMGSNITPGEEIALVKAMYESAGGRKQQGTLPQ